MPSQPAVFAEGDDLDALVAEADAVLEAGDGTPWVGVLAVTGEPTGDGRMIDTGAVTWEDGQAPWPLKWDREEGDHTAMIVGQIDRVFYDGDLLMGEGTLASDSTDEETLAAVNRVVELLKAEGGPVPGVSVELDSETIELRVDKEAWDEWQKEMEAWLDEEVPEAEEPEVVDGRVVVERWTFDDWLEVVTSARFRGAAIVDVPAFADAAIEIAAAGVVPHIDLVGITVLAHGMDEPDYELPPADWFTIPEPEPDDPSVVWVDDDGRIVPAGTEGGRVWGVPLTITADGRVYGHLASWQDCHTAIADRCQPPPMSASGYAWFHTGETMTADGPIATGRITVDTNHAERHLSAASAVGHYDHTGHAVADVTAVDGAMGPWLSGWVRPWATNRQRHELMANPPSGDWRPRGGSTELLGILSVNVPGFPLPRTVATFHRGQLKSLIASGLPPVAEEPDPSVALAARLGALEARVDAEAVLRELESV